MKLLTTDYMRAPGLSDVDINRGHFISVPCSKGKNSWKFHFYHHTVTVWYNTSLGSTLYPWFKGNSLHSNKAMALLSSNYNN